MAEMIPAVETAADQEETITAADVVVAETVAETVAVADTTVIQEWQPKAAISVSVSP